MNTSKVFVKEVTKNVTLHELKLQMESKRSLVSWMVEARNALFKLRHAAIHFGIDSKYIYFRLFEYGIYRHFSIPAQTE